MRKSKQDIEDEAYSIISDDPNDQFESIADLIELIEDYKEFIDITIQKVDDNLVTTRWVITSKNDKRMQELAKKIGIIK